MDWHAARYIAAATAFAGASVLAFCGREGWGWLVFAGILVAIQ